MNASPFDKVECLVHIFEALDTQFWLGGIAAEGLIAEDFEKMDKYHLGVSCQSKYLTVFQLLLGAKGGLCTPSDRSVTKSVTATLRQLTLELSLVRSVYKPGIENITV